MCATIKGSDRFIKLKTTKELRQIWVEKKYLSRLQWEIAFELTQSPINEMYLAQERGMKLRTIKEKMSIVYDFLGIRNRVELVILFWSRPILQTYQGYMFWEDHQRSFTNADKRQLLPRRIRAQRQNARRRRS